MPNSLELNVSPALLHTFANHPFHVRKDMEMNELVDSIRESGVIVPLIVRSRPEGGYEIISGHRRCEACRELGIDLIVTDHHECKEELPPACAVVDPHRGDCPYPFKHLAGVGVALKLVMALGSVSGGEKRANALFHEYADLAAVGTIADVMKLLGENRTIVRLGLEELSHPRRLGLALLIREAGLEDKAIT